MFQAVFNRAESMVGNLVDQALARALVAIPLVVAAGFATAAASTYLNAKYGAQTGHLILAGVFGSIGIVAAVYVSVTTAQSGAGGTTADAEAAPLSQADGTDPTGHPTGLGEVERELLFSTLAAAAPLAAPQIMRGLIRNLPLVLILLIVAFVMTRKVPTQSAASDAGSGGDTGNDGSDQKAKSTNESMTEPMSEAMAA